MARTKNIPRIGDIWQVQNKPFLEGLEIGDTVLILRLDGNVRSAWVHYVCFNMRKECQQIFSSGELITNFHRLAKAPK